MRKYSVQFTRHARMDMFGIYDYVCRSDGQDRAETLLDGIEKQIAELETMPERGPIVPELQELGICDFRERFYKPYRIIYQVVGKIVTIFIIVDGRRDMREILVERALQG